jgi:hypothetical protein
MRAPVRTRSFAVLAILVAEDARAQQGSVVIGSGVAAASASADVRCDDPPGGEVERPVDGDDTAPCRLDGLGRRPDGFLLTSVR